MEAIVRDLVTKLSRPPTPFFPDWGAAAASGMARPYFDASVDGFGASVEQEQPDGS